jgi:hypothetical protein
MREAILLTVANTEDTTFNELLRGIVENGGDVPSNKGEWAQLFRLLEEMEREKLIEVHRTKGKMDGIIMLEAGSAAAKDLRERKADEKDGTRDLFREVFDGHRMGIDDDRIPR